MNFSLVILWVKPLDITKAFFKGINFCMAIDKLESI